VPLVMKPEVELSADARGPFLERAGAGVRHRISVPEALALGFLAATESPDDAASLVSQCLGDDSGPRWLEYVARRWTTYLGGGPLRPFDGSALSRIRWSRYVPATAFTRYAAPAAVSWLVTLACNRRCPYCFYRVLPWKAADPSSPPDATFPLEAALRMVHEMGTIGTADLYLTGGEPLIRRDLLTIIAGASREGIRVHLNTKYAIDDALAARLAAAAVAEVSVSLDDARPRIAGALAGARNYLAEATASLGALRQAGVRVRVNAVATRLNIDHLDELVRGMIALGVPTLTVSPFADPIPLRRSAQGLAPAGESLSTRVATLRDRYGGRITLEIGSGEAFGPGSIVSCGDRLLCEVGIRTLDVLPDGSVTRCRYLPDQRALVVGDLKTESLMDVWKGPRLAALYAPSPEAYAGTACSGCGSFGRCNARGRCFASALSTHERLHAPDAACTSTDRP